MPKLEQLNTDIKESGLKKVFLADKMGITRMHLYDLLIGKAIFTIEEADQLSKLLHYSAKQKRDIFLP